MRFRRRHAARAGREAASQLPAPRGLFHAKLGVMSVAEPRRIALFRHAKADWPQVTDHERLILASSLEQAIVLATDGWLTAWRTRLEHYPAELAAVEPERGEVAGASHCGADTG